MGTLLGDPRALIALAFIGACAPKPAPTPAFPDAPAVVDLEAATRPSTPTPVVPMPVPEPIASEPAAIVGPMAALTGAYRYRGGKASVRRSIDDVVGDMNIMVRSIARKRLIAANAVPQRIAIDQVGAEITVRIDGRAYVASLDGPAQRVRDANGERSRMRFELRDGALYQIFHAEQGDRTNVFTEREDGGLAMAVRIHSRQLPSDVRYKLSFAEAN